MELVQEGSATKGLLALRKHLTKCIIYFSSVQDVGQQTLIHHLTVAGIDVQHDIQQGRQIEGQLSPLKGLCNQER